jgi:hypothetical protein
MDLLIIEISLFWNFIRDLSEFIVKNEILFVHTKGFLFITLAWYFHYLIILILLISNGFLSYLFVFSSILSDSLKNDITELDPTFGRLGSLLFNPVDSASFFI